MAKIEIVIWNIETFGDYPRRGNDNVVLWFMAALQRTFGFDVLIIQELRKKGRLLLPSAAYNLAGTKRAPWTYDYLPGAIKPASTTVPRANLTFADLDWTVNANKEGYAVLARPGLLNPFATNHSFQGKTSNGTGIVNLLLTGVEPVIDGDQSPPISPAPGNPRPLDRARFPRPRPDYIAASSTRDDFDRTAKKQRIAAPPLNWSGCRRPCHVKVAFANSVIDVLAYHAPVDVDGCVYGSLACGLSEPIWDPAHYPNVVVGGDFNTFSSSLQKAGFANFRSANMLAGTGQYDPPSYQNSMVRYTVGNQGTTLLPANDPCTGSPRDFLFYNCQGLPSGATVHNLVWDLVPELKDDATLAVQRDHVISSCVQQTIRAGLAPDAGPKIKIPDFEVPVAKQLLTIFDPKNPQPFPDNLSVAYFYRQFISDHLPLVTTIDDGAA